MLGVWSVCIAGFGWRIADASEVFGVQAREICLMGERCLAWPSWELIMGTLGEPPLPTGGSAGGGGRGAVLGGEGGKIIAKHEWDFARDLVGFLALDWITNLKMSDDNCLEALTSAEFLKQIYSAPPGLSNVSIFDLRLDRDAAAMRLRFNLPEFPDNPPDKWKQSGFNRLQITPRLIDMLSISIDGWNYNVVGDLSICKELSGISLSFFGSDVKIRCSGTFLIVEKISPYHEGSLDDE